MNTQWKLASFSDLHPAELYDLIRLRIEVFVVEQGCIFQDLDNKDQAAHHLMGRDKSGNLLAYARILPPGIIYPEASIGRVTTSPSARGKGLGKELMKNGLFQLYGLFGPVPIKIGAQIYLLKFYESFGFRKCSEVYLEDDIAHILMILPIP